MAVVERKQKEKLQRYNAILDAAEKIMRKNGLQNLNIDLIAKETELAKGTLYLYFKNKEEIIGALSVKSRVLLLNQFKKVTQKLQNPIEKLKAITQASFNFYKENPFYFEVITVYEADKSLIETPEIQESINNLIVFVNNITVAAKEQGLLNKKLDPVKYTFCLWGMIIGVSQLIKVRGEAMKSDFGFSEQEIFDTYMEQLENGMKE